MNSTVSDLYPRLEPHERAAAIEADLKTLIAAHDDAMIRLSQLGPVDMQTITLDKLNEVRRYEQVRDESLKAMMRIWQANRGFVRFAVFAESSPPQAAYQFNSPTDARLDNRASLV